MFAHFRAAAGLVVLVVSTACSGGAPPPPPDWCMTTCSYYNNCDPKDVNNCVKSCDQEYAGYFARTTSEFRDLQAQCVDDTDKCHDRTEEDAFMQCASTVSLALEPTAAVGDFCDTMAATFFDCSSYASPTECLSENAGFSEPALVSGAGCEDVACEDLGSCLNSELWSYGQ